MNSKVCSLRFHHGKKEKSFVLNEIRTYDKDQIYPRTEQ